MIKLVHYHTFRKVASGTESAFRVALVKGGHKWLKVVAIDSGGLRVWKVPSSDQRYMTPLMKGSKPYPMNRALIGFRKFLREHGGTKGAKKFLQEASREQKEKQDTPRKTPASTSGDHA